MIDLTASNQRSQNTYEIGEESVCASTLNHRAFSPPWALSLSECIGKGILVESGLPVAGPPTMASGSTRTLRCRSAIGSGRGTHDRLEIPDEVGLIEVAQLDSQLGPILVA